MAPKTSQKVIDDFWKKFITPSTPPTKASAILPKNIYASKISKLVPQGATTSHPVSASYDAAVASCKAKVVQIVRECRSINQKYSDPYFNLSNLEDCLSPLHRIRRERRSGSRASSRSRSEDGDSDDASNWMQPPSVKRVTDIFDNPRFYVDGAQAKDIQQGYNGDCWFLSALMALCNIGSAGSLIERICVTQDQEVGVYGFVVFRDGEWISVIVDDKLYLRKPDYENCDEHVRREWEENRVRVNSQEEYRKEYQTNSRALWFAQSTHPDETWVPLLEKAYAKAHGDYGAIEGGWVGEGVEDLTGGASMNIYTSNILSKQKFWDELKLVNKEYLFGCSSPWYDDPYMEGRNGIMGMHAYSILRAVEYKDEKLVLVKNPWGKTEWKGPWSDGSREWTAESIKDLGHTFGDDGIFWIRYPDLLKTYDQFYRTRLFTDDWRVTQQWVNCAIPWSGTYQDTKFAIVVEKAAPMVIMLSQLDERYFRGLVGQYYFDLSFRVANQGDDEDYIIRTAAGVPRSRSVHTELTLEPGTYEVRLKIVGTRDEHKPKIEDVVRENWLVRREKLLRTGLSYDLAHAKAQVKEPENEKEENKKPQVSKKVPIKTVVTKTTTTETYFTDSKKDDKKSDKEKEKKKDDKKTEGGEQEKKDDKKAEVGEKERSGDLKKKASKDNITTGPDGTKPEPTPIPVPAPVEIAEIKKDEDAPFETTEDKSGEHPAIVDPQFAVVESTEDKADNEEKIKDKTEERDDDAASVTSSSSSKADSSDDELTHEKRWAAVAVVGLRVYSKDADVTIRVIRPEVPTKMSDKTKLDVDDPAKDASKAEGLQIEIEGEKAVEDKKEDVKIEGGKQDTKDAVMNEETTFLSEKSQEKVKVDETSTGTESAEATPESSEGGEKKTNEEKLLVIAEPVEEVPAEKE